jgi:hypothetical protein
MSKPKVSKALFAMALCLASVPLVQAQVVTTSAFTGTVQNDQNQPIKGAEIKLVHVPTGTEYTITSKADGAFSLSGLRPGGPYKVAVHSEGLADYSNEEVFLEIDQGANLSVHMHSQEITQLEKLEVTASAMDQMFDVNATGSGSYLTSKDISETAVGDRSINSLVRKDPRVTYNRDPSDRAISVSGISNRYNMIQVDGVSASDPFGLNANNTAADRNVIPLDSIEAISINTSPYNARNSGFVGAQINAITKSGTNTFHGSAYYTFRGNSVNVFGKDLQMVGENLDNTYYRLSKFEEQTYGLTLGGPIIPKKLFFYISFEKVDENRVAPSVIAKVDGATIQKILTVASSLGFKPGSNNPPDANKLKDNNFIAKLDWQISANHRATLRFNTVDSSRPNFPTFSSGAGQNNFSFDSTWYKQDTKDTAVIGQLISHWTDDLDTEFSLSHSKYHAEPKNNSTQPYVEIRNVPVVGSTSAYISFGTEYSRHLNVLDVKSNAADLAATYRLGSRHTIQSGVQYDINDIYNAYVQYHYGYYLFTSLDDFLNKAATGGAAGTYTYNKFNDGVDPAATFKEANAGVYVNDHWRIMDNLTADVGLRADRAILPTEIPFNQKFYNTFGVRNDGTYDGKTIVQPRFGFNYQPNFKRRTIIRGGAGLFYGRMPRVWLSNSYSNTGFNYSTYTLTATSSSTVKMPAVSSDPNNQPTSGSAPSQTVAFLADNFKLPSRMKANLAVEHELGFWDLKATAEAEGSWVVDDVFYTNINIVPTASGPDGRQLYWDKYNATATTVPSGTRLVNTGFNRTTIKLGNTGKGDTKAYTFSVERPRKSDGWSWKAAYVSTRVDEVLFGTSSVASSNWNNRSIFNANSEEMHRGELEIKDRILVSVGKDFKFFGDKNPTSVGLLYDGHSGLPFSLVYNNDLNGDGVSSANDLLYVPVRGDYSVVRFADYKNSAGAVLQTAAQAEQNFNAIVDRFGLKQGSVLASDSQRYPWVNTFDLSLKQKIKLPGWRHSLTLGADILNIGNLLNPKWGIIRGSNQFFVKQERVANATYDATSKQYVYSNVSSALASNGFSPALGRGEPAATRWSVLFSARYEF